MPARPSVSWREPRARSAVITASAHEPRSTVDSIASGSSSAQRRRRRWTTGWRGGISRLAASAVVDGRIDPGEHPRARHAAAPEHLLGERHQPVGAAMSRRSGDEAAATRLARDEPVRGQSLHGVPCRHPADPELGAQLGVGRQALAGAEGRDPLAERLLDLAVLGLVGGLGHGRPPTVWRPRIPRRSRPSRPPLRGWRPRSPRPTCRARRSRPRPRPATSCARGRASPPGSGRAGGRRPPRCRRR